MKLLWSKAGSLLGCAGLAFGIAADVAQAQSYPVKTVRIIVPFPPGGLTDAMARLMARSFSTELGQPVVVDNRPGASGILGTELAAKSPPDGYVLLVTQSGLTILPNIKLKPGFDPVKDFQPVSTLASYIFYLVAHPSTPARSVKDLIALAKARPGQINYGSTGSGSGMHLAAELFATSAGVRITHIPYKGEAPTITDLLGGQIAIVFGTNVVFPHIKSQRLIPLAVTGASRSTVLPNVPTVAESGLPGYEVTSWNALFAPSGTPAPIVNRLNALVKQALALQETKDFLSAQSLDAASSTPQELAQMIKTELVKWAQVVKAAGIQPD